MSRVEDRKFFENLLLSAITGTTPGAVAYVGKFDEIIFFGAKGKKSLIPAEENLNIDTIYDLASLTKVVATTTAVMLLYQEGKINLDDSVSKYLPIRKFKGILIKHLLTHSSGLPAYAEWYREINSFEDFLIKLYKEDLLFSPGTAHLYSDFGFILLGHIVELVSGVDLENFCKQNIFLPLNMVSTFFRVPEEFIDRCAPTELCSWRGVVVRGKVHDENAYALGGVAGHAGLFSTAEDLSKFCRTMIYKKLLKPEVIEEMATTKIIPNYPWQVLGWKTDPFWDSIEGVIPFRSALGHTGFTGTCMWWDRVSGYYAILLSNSCHPSRRKRDNKKLRKTFYNGVSIFINPKKINVHPGVDVLMRDEFKVIEGARIGVYTNTSAMSAYGKSTLEVLSSSTKFHIVCIFAGEHGLRVSEEAGKGEINKDWRGIPIIDIFTDYKNIIEKRALLRKIEWIVVDIPDIGARYYTYLASINKLLRLAVEYNLKVLVLDRPNPLGGEIIEGPLPSKGFIGDVCWGDVPIRHGMTVGESCMFLKGYVRDLNGVDLEVVKVDGWFRDLMFDRVDLPWVPPSPNILDFQSALCYVGTCLLEGTNLSEGRGTKSPFRMVGAPWLKVNEVLEVVPKYAVEGVRLDVCEFVPESIPGKVSRPKYMGEKCKGIKIEIENPYLFKPFTFGYELLVAVRKVNRDSLRFSKFFDELAGGDFIRGAIESGNSYSQIQTQVKQDIEKFLSRKPCLYTSMNSEIARL